MRRPASRLSAAPDVAPIAVRIDRVGHQGDGLGRLPDGTLVCVPGTLPGEYVTAVPIGSGGKLTRATLVRVESQSPDRVDPPCPHAHACGGCRLQHWAEPSYLRWKAERLHEALSRAGYSDAPIAPVIATPTNTRRRVDLAYAPSGADVALGFHVARGRDVVNIRDCVILHDALRALLDPLRRLLPSLSGGRYPGSVHINLLDNGPDILFRLQAALTRKDSERLLSFGTGVGACRIHYAVGNAEPTLLISLAAPFVRFGGVKVTPPPGSFLQASRDGERHLVQAVLDALPSPLPKRARFLDLFAGCGTFTFPLAAYGIVDAYEGNGPAIAALRDAAHHALPGRIKGHHRDLSRQPVAGRELEGYAAAVVDPPWLGAPAQIAALAASSVGLIIYVSCNPAALATDAQTLHVAGFTVLRATPIDQFVWSADLESVIVFARGRSAR
ncbi:class I SAM-dependent RNA methyltransferase [Acidisphaera rubrifaciens]|uniref:Ribosomal RNA 23S/tRNA (Uracil-5-)methyltransferase n=1 Tax=Acidisphaera rubrifaciens HS-AP3 TaxID=1231350 RepID=A0A0D6P2P9_9PROT|nr:TRAM domain-containing protein [Acidisphaera rubrifaciens]GAN76045.1 ribosomal RNA 23S/tRNA (uracil-5-)methyltransferase [Acidisphaera rubrifaciens HS-AP3]